MPRPRCARRIHGRPGARTFKPAGTPASSLEEVVLRLEEFEALRLADHEGLYHEDAAKRMGVSRQTLGRTLSAARAKVARALVLGLALVIEDGQPQDGQLQSDEAPQLRHFHCEDCAHAWSEPFGTGRPTGCPACASQNFHREGCTGGHPHTTTQEDS